MGQATHSCGRGLGKGEGRREGRRHRQGVCEEGTAPAQHSNSTVQYRILDQFLHSIQIIVVSDARQLEINCSLICSRILLVHEIVKKLEIAACIFFCLRGTYPRRISRPVPFLAQRANVLFWVLHKCLATTWVLKYLPGKSCIIAWRLCLKYLLVQTRRYGTCRLYTLTYLPHTSPTVETCTAS